MRCSSLRSHRSNVHMPVRAPVSRDATAGCWLHQRARCSLPYTSILSVGSPALFASSISAFSRSSTPRRPALEPLATRTKRPPCSNVRRGIGLSTSPVNRAGSPACPALNCQQVSVSPSQRSASAGRAFHPSQPLSRASTFGAGIGVRTTAAIGLSRQQVPHQLVQVEIVETGNESGRHLQCVPVGSRLAHGPQ